MVVTCMAEERMMCMNKINWKVRFSNPIFVFQILASIFLPILAYFGFEWKDMTSWPMVMNVLIDAVKNPVVLVTALLSFWNAVNDPTTKGLFDSTKAQAYIKPN